MKCSCHMWSLLQKHRSHLTYKISGEVGSCLMAWWGSGRKITQKKNCGLYICEHQVVTVFVRNSFPLMKCSVFWPSGCIFASLVLHLLICSNSSSPCKRTSVILGKGFILQALMDTLFLGVLSSTAVPPCFRVILVPPSTFTQKCHHAQAMSP